MSNDPDIIRWSQIKRFLKHTIAWMAVYGIGGWLIDVSVEPKLVIDGVAHPTGVKKT